MIPGNEGIDFRRRSVRYIHFLFSLPLQGEDGVTFMYLSAFIGRTSRFQPRNFRSLPSFRLNPNCICLSPSSPWNSSFFAREKNSVCGSKQEATDSHQALHTKPG